MIHMQVLMHETRTMLDDINRSIEMIDAKFEAIDRRLDSIEGRLWEIELILHDGPAPMDWDLFWERNEWAVHDPNEEN